MIRSQIGVGQSGVVQILVPLAGVILEQKMVEATLFLASTSSSTSRASASLRAIEQPLVQDEQLVLLELFHVIPVGSIGPGATEISTSRSGRRIYRTE